MSSVLEKAKRIVVKVGSGLVTNEGRGLDHDALTRWAGQVAELRRIGREVVLVSSGAIAAGMQRLGWKRRPHALHELQAAAAGRPDVMVIVSADALTPHQAVINVLDAARRAGLVRLSFAAQVPADSAGR